MTAATYRINQYLTERAMSADLDYDAIHTFHRGTERQASLLASDLFALLGEVRRLRDIETAARVQYDAYGAYPGLIAALEAKP